MQKLGSRIYSNRSSLTNRGGNAILDAPFIPEGEEGGADHIPGSSDPDQELDMEEVRAAMLEGASMVDLAKKYPNRILRAIKDFGVKKLGETDLEDSLVLDGFGQQTMLTRGMDTVDDVNWRANWVSFLEQRAKNSSRMNMGWSRKVRVAAYAVTIKNAANPKFEGLLHPILLNVKAGAAVPAVLQLPALKALLLYKWKTWARRTLHVENLLYCAWLVSYTIFMYCLKGAGAEAWNSHPDMHNPYLGAAHVFNTAAFVAMLPFLFIELHTIYEYRWGWLSLWNLIDTGSYVIQTLTFVVFCFRSHHLSKDWFSVILAVQSILLFLRLQFYLRAFSSHEVSFVDVLIAVVLKSRFFFLMLGLTILSFSMAFYILFRWPLHRDRDPDDRCQRHSEFQEMYDYFETPWMALSAVFEMLLGSFEFEQFFDSSVVLEVTTTVIFVLFHLLVGITYLNLLIAIITEAYIKIMDKEEIYRDSSRAHIIDELEMMLPAFLLRRKSDPFIHFLVVKPSNHNNMEASRTLLGSLSVGTSGNVEGHFIRELSRVPSGTGDDALIDKIAERVAAKVLQAMATSQQTSGGGGEI